mmetsp:Transcript_17020/g.48890  ORF Transcript_17020/g.48890 Transcript_17020/m.48890 type:complete len:232 (-) Transcript_17020:111-806(-)
MRHTSIMTSTKQPIPMPTLAPVLNEDGSFMAFWNVSLRVSAASPRLPRIDPSSGLVNVPSPVVSSPSVSVVLVSPDVFIPPPSSAGSPSSPPPPSSNPSASGGTSTPKIDASARQSAYVKQLAKPHPSCPIPSWQHWAGAQASVQAATPASVSRLSDEQTSPRLSGADSSSSCSFLRISLAACHTWAAGWGQTLIRFEATTAAADTNDADGEPSVPTVSAPAAEPRIPPPL